MKKNFISLFALCFMISSMSACSALTNHSSNDDQFPNGNVDSISSSSSSITSNNNMYRGFSLDNVIESEYGEIHYNLYIPSSYDGRERYALYLTLPGYEGLYRFGIGANLKSENFAFEAQEYNEKMLIVAPQLNDWGERSARQTIVLTKYFFENYNIDRNKVYINGYSGGGETLSLVLTYQPELYTAALHVASIWDGNLDAIVKAQTPIYFVIGESDEYYGSARISNTYQQLVSFYKEEGLLDEQISDLAILDVKSANYFNGFNQHGGIGKVASDEQIMGWLFNH